MLVLDFVRSIPLLRVSPDLSWLEELVEKVDPVVLDAHELALQGQLEPTYQPAWLQHPVYAQLQEIARAQPLLQLLDEYRLSVDQCAADTLRLLRRIYDDVEDAVPRQTLGENQWRFVFTVGQSAVGWFRGTYLEQPSPRDYILDTAGYAGESPSFFLGGNESTPFRGPIVEDLTEEEAIFLRDLHLRLRNDYMSSEDARLLAAKLAATDAWRDQLLQETSQLGRADTGRGA